MGLESTIEANVCYWAKQHGITNLKLAGPNQKGQSDRMFMRRGRAVFLEFKAPGNKPTPLQERFMQARRDDGFAASWFDDSDAAKRWLAKQFITNE